MQFVSSYVESQTSEKQEKSLDTGKKRKPYFLKNVFRK